MKPYIHEVKYYETDRMGITHHSNYIRIMEEARVDYLEQLGLYYWEMEEMGVASPVLSLEVKYLNSTTFHDRIEVMAEVSELTAVRLAFSYTMKVGETVVFTVTSHHAFVGKEGKIISLRRDFPEVYEVLKRELEEAQET